MTQLLNQVVGAGISTVPMLRQLLSTNGHTTPGDEKERSRQTQKPERQRSSGT
jgi:hypothetical protein